ncbi:MAG: hypothetical protein AAFX81_04675 [Pseudomonadota bacterium]
MTPFETSVIVYSPLGAAAPRSGGSGGEPDLRGKRSRGDGGEAVMALKSKAHQTSWRGVSVGAGAVCLSVGTLVWLSPAPGGFLLLGLGASLVLANSHAAKRRFLGLKRRYPQLLSPLRRLLRVGRSRSNV